MARSSFISRFSLPREKSPILPLHAKSEYSRSSDFDLKELSPKPSHSVLFSAADAASSDFSPESLPTRTRPYSVSDVSQESYRDRPSSSRTLLRQPLDDDYDSPQTRQPFLFTGPPPPIARSMYISRDVEDHSGSALGYSQQKLRNNGDPGMSYTSASSSHHIAGRNGPQLRQKPSSAVWRRNNAATLDGDSTWTVLQRRERALQQELQLFLDAQAAGLLAGLGRQPSSSDAGYGPSSDSGLDGGKSSSRSNTPSTEPTASHSLRPPSERSLAATAVIPVRQPRPKRLGLHSARVGLARNISLLTDLKAEEDTLLEAALLARKRALGHLRRLSERRGNIVREIETLETDQEEPLARELDTLQTGYMKINQEIVDAEQRLVLLKHRKHTLEKDMELVRSKRDSGLSGYRGALKEVDEQLTAMLRRPPLQPLAMDALGVSSAGREDQGEVKTHLDENDIAADDDATLDASAGLEFLQLLPERRTAEMAEFWWENDIRLLEKRRTAVIAERAALDEGGTVWQEAVRLVSGFEANLRKEMTVTSKDEHGGGGIKKANSPTPEERMQSQLQATAKVSKSLQSLVQKAEEKGWNLLVCAIGAELEAFQEACLMLRQVLHDAGVETERDGDEIEEVWPQFDGCHNSDSNDCLIDAEDPAIVSAKPAVSDSYDYDDRIATPKLARSARGASVNTFEATRHNHDSNAESEYDADDVPPDLLTAHGRSLEGSEKSQDRSNRLQASQNRRDDEDDSNEDEVPLEFLSEHQSDDDGES